MAHSYVIEHDLRIFIVRILGEVRANDFSKLEKEIRSMTFALKYKVIFDFRKAKVKICIGEAYFIYAIRFDRARFEFWNVPTAHIVNPDYNDLFSFIDLVCLNDNLKIKTFKAKREALKLFNELDLITTNQISAYTL